MSDQSLLQALQRELALERAARQELEKQTVLKTRQLWHLREQQDKEVKQYQEQLSVVRVSLMLAHKQQQPHVDPYDSVQRSSPEQLKQSLAALRIQVPEPQPSQQQDEDASPTKADQRKASRQFGPNSPQKPRPSHQPQQQQLKQQSGQQSTAVGDVHDGHAAASGAAQETHAAQAINTGCAGQQHQQQQEVPQQDAEQPQQQQQQQLEQQPQSQQDTQPQEQQELPSQPTQQQQSMQQQQQQQPQQPTPQQPQQVLAAGDAEQLLVAATKVQQLVERLSTAEPSAAADLSVLQWQLTALYGRLTGCSPGTACQTSKTPPGRVPAQAGSGACADSSTSSSGSDGSSGSNGDGSEAAATPGMRGGVLHGVSCTGRDPLSAACSPAAAAAGNAGASTPSRAAAAVRVDAATGTSPGLSTPSPSAAVQQQEPEGLHGAPASTEAAAAAMQEAARTAAAARLFSGAANKSSGNSSKLVADSLSWFYLEPGDPPVVKGPYDAGLMMRWFLKGFLDNALRIAAIVQTGSTLHSSSSGCSSGSSSSGTRSVPESTEVFQSLGQLLQQVQAGQGYVPAKAVVQQPQQQRGNAGAAAAAATAAGRQGAHHHHHRATGSTGSISSSSLATGPFEDAGAAAGMGGSPAGRLSRAGGALLGLQGSSSSGGLGTPKGGGGGLLSETVGYWLDLAASAQLPGGSLSLVDIIDKVLSVAPQPGGSRP